MPWRAAAIAATLLGALWIAAPADAVTITEFPVEAGAPAGQHIPYFIVTGADGNLWFTDPGPRRGIGRITPGGARISPLPVTAPPFDVIAGADGAMYWTEDESPADQGHVVRYAANGTRTELARNGAKPWALARASDGSTWWTEQNYSSPTPGEGNYVCHATNPIAWSGATCFVSRAGGSPPRLTGLALAPNDALWFASYEDGRLGRFDLSNDKMDRSVMVQGSGLYRVARGPDGNMWAVDYKGSRILRVASDGTAVGTGLIDLAAGRGPNDIVAGPDGALWFTEFDANRIGRMTTDGVLTNEFAVPTPGSTPWGITVGPDGNIWFTESTAGKIGRLTLDRAGGGGGGGGGGSGGGGPGGVVVDSVAPRFDRGLAVLPGRFRAGAAATVVRAAARHAAPVGSAFTFSLSEPATVVIAISHGSAGRRVGRTCRPPTRANRGHQRCVRRVADGTLTRRGLQGPNRVAFSGRIGRRKLGPGAHRASAAAKDSAGNASRTSSATFTIVAS
ncbi:MAG: hypothetical protein QOE65_1872 [Solirubrobacteraceae bacterium]|jgi:virginiamycin B lyase|nr:hypothetical protein [Solirubrobacteraceae bacterium]